MTLGIPWECDVDFIFSHRVQNDTNIIALYTPCNAIVNVICFSYSKYNVTSQEHDELEDSNVWLMM